MALSDLSNLFWKQSKFEQGLQYGLQSEALFKQRGLEDMDYSFTLYVIGNNYMYLISIKWLSSNVENWTPLMPCWKLPKQNFKETIGLYC